jgi:thiosulfate/3-mercaptopyruvate sulfurtransferase
MKRVPQHLSVKLAQPAVSQTTLVAYLYRRLLVKSRSMSRVEMLFIAGLTWTALAPALPAQQASLIPDSRLIQPEELVKVLQSPKSEKPVLIQVGSHVLYSEGHIPGSEYIGPASNPNGLQQLRKRLESLPSTKFIVIYCGCCPWSHCPNIEPADRLLQSMGFTNVKVLYIANNFGADWVDKGYPVAKGD